MLNNYTDASDVNLFLEKNIRIENNDNNLLVTNNKKMNSLNSEMNELFRSLPKIASAVSSILITGETGTGKEIIADYIHEIGNRSREPYIKVNCSSIPESLFEAEFMGVEKGAFTDADRSRPGFLEKCGKGILFLDEISDFPLSVQGKLLQVFKTGRFYRLGSQNEQFFTGRIITSSTRSLSSLLKEKKVREDLIYLLAVIPLHVPPLRERKEDIKSIAKEIVVDFSQKNGIKSKQFSLNALEKLLSYEWFGNIRELENKIERALVLSKGEEITASDLFPEEVELFHSPAEGTKPLKLAVQDFKRRYIVQTLEQNDWNQTRTARVLQIQRTYLSRLIKELDIKQYKGDSIESV